MYRVEFRDECPQTRETIPGLPDELLVWVESTADLDQWGEWGDFPRIGLGIGGKGCPLDCQFCGPGLDRGLDIRRITLEEMEFFILEALEASGGKEKVKVVLTGGEVGVTGEPLLKPERVLTALRKLDQIKKNLQGKGITLIVGLNTCGAIGQPESLIEALADAGLDEMTISLNAYEPESYALLCGPRRAFEEAINFSQTALKTMGPKRVVASFVDLSKVDHNLWPPFEPEKAIAFARSLGFERIVLRKLIPVFPVRARFEGAEAEEWEEICGKMVEIVCFPRSLFEQVCEGNAWVYLGERYWVKAEKGPGGENKVGVYGFEPDGYHGEQVETSVGKGKTGVSCWPDDRGEWQETREPLAFLRTLLSEGVISTKKITLGLPEPDYFLGEAILKSELLKQMRFEIIWRSIYNLVLDKQLLPEEILKVIKVRDYSESSLQMDSLVPGYFSSWHLGVRETMEARDQLSYLWHQLWHQLERYPELITFLLGQASQLKEIKTRGETDLETARQEFMRSERNDSRAWEYLREKGRTVLQAWEEACQTVRESVMNYSRHIGIIASG